MNHSIVATFVVLGIAIGALGYIAGKLSKVVEELHNEVDSMQRDNRLSAVVIKECGDLVESVQGQCDRIIDRVQEEADKGRVPPLYEVRPMTDPVPEPDSAMVEPDFRPNITPRTYRQVMEEAEEQMFHSRFRPPPGSNAPAPTSSLATMPTEETP